MRLSVKRLVSRVAPRTLGRWAKSGLALVISTFVGVALTFLGTAAYGVAPHTSGAIGNDVSFPQCGMPLPTAPAFAIVGVNDGVSDQLNPCFGISSSFPTYSTSELYWSVTNAVGLPSQPKASLYLNTDDPGDVFDGSLIPDWPSSGNTPYGACTATTVSTSDGPKTAGANSTACAWQFGDEQSLQDVTWLQSAASSINAQGAPVTVPGTAASYPWWLDVETANTWQSGTLGQAMNVAVLQGMIAGLNASGAESVGIYAASNQWEIITGGTSATTTSLGGLNDWIPGATSESGAQANCADSSFTSGRVSLAQWISGGYDYDIVCGAASVQQIYGVDAIGTSIAISQAEFPSADSAHAVVLARSDFFSDALAGGPLAAAVGGPLLITPGAPVSSALDPRVEAEIERVLPVGDTVYVLGGELALSPNIDTTLSGLGYRVVRIAGADEYATAVDIAEQLGNPSTIFEATGLNFYDALSAVPAAIKMHAAILLTDGSTQAPETAAYLAQFPSDTRYAIGGPLAAAGADPSATPIYGQDLYGTSAAVANQFFPGASVFGAATSADFPDALGGGVFMASGGRLGPILLVGQTTPLPPPISAYLASLAPTTPGYVFGGPLAVSPTVVSAIQSSVG
jgi:hypothetical protein